MAKPMVTAVLPPGGALGPLPLEGGGCALLLSRGGSSVRRVRHGVSGEFALESCERQGVGDATVWLTVAEACGDAADAAGGRRRYVVCGWRPDPESAVCRASGQQCCAPAPPLPPARQHCALLAEGETASLSALGMEGPAQVDLTLLQCAAPVAGTMCAPAHHLRRRGEAAVTAASVASPWTVGALSSLGVAGLVCCVLSLLHYAHRTAAADPPEVQP